MSALSAAAAGRWEIEILCADLEAGPWPLTGRAFDAVVVTNYLWRPRIAETIACVGEGGILIYETFADGQQTVGRPTRSDFLLRRGELLDLTRGMRVIAFEDGFASDPDRFVQRLAAWRCPAGEPDSNPRFDLGSGRKVAG